MKLAERLTLMLCESKNLGPKPASDKISFSDDCFKVVGKKKMYKVIFGTNRYPEKFDNKKDAEEFAKKNNRKVTEYEEEVKERIKWF